MLSPGLVPISSNESSSTSLEAARQSDATEVIHQDNLAGALLDINLGNETAYPIADELFWRQIPFIFLTRYGAMSVEPGFRKFPTLTKPFTRRQLHEVMNRVFGSLPAAHHA